MRLAIAAGPAMRVCPGQSRDVTAPPHGGNRTKHGFRVAAAKNADRAEQFDVDEVFDAWPTN
mgnify:CR=1 FL=1